MEKGMVIGKMCRNGDLEEKMLRWGFLVMGKVDTYLPVCESQERRVVVLAGV